MSGEKTVLERVRDAARCGRGCQSIPRLEDLTLLVEHRATDSPYINTHRYVSVTDLIDGFIEDHERWVTPWQPK